MEISLTAIDLAHYNSCDVPSVAVDNPLKIFNVHCYEYFTANMREMKEHDKGKKHN